MGIASRSARRTARVDSTARDGNARVRRSEDSRGAPQAEAELLSRESSLQQLVVHVEGGAAPGVGVPGTLGEQTHRHRRPTAAPVPAPMSPLNAPDSPTWPDCQLRTPTPER